MADKKNDGVITNLVRRKIQTYKTMEEAGMLDPRGAKELEKLRKLYPSMFNYHALVHQVQRVTLVLSRRAAWGDRNPVLARYIGS